MPRVIHVFRQPERFVAGTVGEPGDRSFYLQAIRRPAPSACCWRSSRSPCSRSASPRCCRRSPRRFGSDTPAGTSDADADPLAVPREEEFRVGTMGLGWDADSRSIVVELLAVSEEEVDERRPRRHRGGAGRAAGVPVPGQARAFAERAERVVSAGRSPCPLCAEPLDPAGHVCIRLNGYHRRATLAD